jgi:hypothetical protein
MRTLGVLGPVIGVLALALGVYSLSNGHSNGLTLTVIGAALIVFWAIALPLARRRKKI